MRVASILALVCLAGCASAPAQQVYHHWTKPGFQPAQMNADWYACVKENSTTATTVDNIGGSIEVHKQQDGNDAMSIQCMKARGYTLTATDGNPN
jgi:hypothetical protein